MTWYSAIDTQWGIRVLKHLSQPLDRTSRILNRDPRGRHGSDLWWKWGFGAWQLKRCDKRLSHGSGRRSALGRISCWLHPQNCFVYSLLENCLWAPLFWQMNMFHLQLNIFHSRFTPWSFVCTNGLLALTSLMSATEWQKGRERSGAILNASRATAEWQETICEVSPDLTSNKISGI